jgi:Fe2+ or Zn2+ uptake regulation protein
MQPAPRKIDPPAPVIERRKTYAARPLSSLQIAILDVVRGARAFGLTSEQITRGVAARGFNPMSVRGTLNRLVGRGLVRRFFEPGETKSLYRIRGAA